MITPSMTDEELKVAAYQDFLEIKMKVQILLEQFAHNLKTSQRTETVDPFADGNEDNSHQGEEYLDYLLGKSIPIAR